MIIDRIERSKHKRGRILLFLEDGSLLKITEQELLDFGLRAGDRLDDETLESLRQSASDSGAKAEAAALIGRRAMSRSDLERKLIDKGASAREATYAAEWLEAIGALNDADYAALLIRHCVNLGYGPARYRDELRKHGIDRELWEEAMEAAPPPQEVIDKYLADRFRRGMPDDRERKRAADALARRGFGWNDVKVGMAKWASENDFDD